MKIIKFKESIRCNRCNSVYDNSTEFYIIDKQNICKYCVEKMTSVKISTLYKQWKELKSIINFWNTGFNSFKKELEDENFNKFNMTIIFSQAKLPKNSLITWNGSTYSKTMIEQKIKDIKLAIKKLDRENEQARNN